MLQVKGEIEEIVHAQVHTYIFFLRALLFVVYLYKDLNIADIGIKGNRRRVHKGLGTVFLLNYSCGISAFFLLLFSSLFFLPFKVAFFFIALLISCRSFLSNVKQLFFYLRRGINVCSCVGCLEEKRAYLYVYIVVLIFSTLLKCWVRAFYHFT